MDFRRIVEDAWSITLGSTGLTVSAVVCVVFIFRDRIPTMMMPFKRKNPHQVEKSAVREKRMKHYLKVKLKTLETLLRSAESRAPCGLE